MAASCSGPCCPSGTLLWWNLWLDPSEQAQPWTSGRGPTPLEKSYSLSSTSRQCVCEFLCTCWGRHCRRQRWVGCERQKWWDENEERRHLAFILDTLNANALTCETEKDIWESLSCVFSLLICFGYVLCGWMKVIHSERGQQCIHRAEIMLLFGYLCSP